MARTVIPLSDSKCEAARYNPGGKNNKLFDGGGLYLLLKPTGSKSWRMKYIKPNGKEDTLVVGDYPAVTLKKARQAREAAKALLAEGLDPKQQKREEEIQQRQANEATFEAVALEWHKAMSE
ncbi:MAG TPA: Arm DNA-binding domain-containing protein, partial [Moraxellaceae bacterium]|nr:Arm DNA-binding domain-containing protein [Moraxellaceae bacterium]